MKSIHDSMVPFWQRPTLALVLPACTIGAMGVLLIVALLAERAAEQTADGPVSSIAMAWAVLLGIAAIGPPVLLAPLLVAHPQPRSRLGPGFWFAAVIIAFRTLSLVVIVAYGLIRMLMLQFTSTAVLPASLAALLIGALATAAILIRFTAIPRPREQALHALELGVARAGVVVTAVMAAAWLGLLEASDHRVTLLLAALQLAAALALTMTALPGVLIYRRLGREHAAFHDARCRRCGYDLAGVDEQPCPECGTVNSA